MQIWLSHVGILAFYCDYSELSLQEKGCIPVLKCPVSFLPWKEENWDLHQDGDAHNLKIIAKDNMPVTFNFWQSYCFSLWLNVIYILPVASSWLGKLRIYSLYIDSLIQKMKAFSFFLCSCVCVCVWTITLPFYLFIFEYIWGCVCFIFSNSFKIPSLIICCIFGPVLSMEGFTIAEHILCCHKMASSCMHSTLPVAVLGQLLTLVSSMGGLLPNPRRQVQ